MQITVAGVGGTVGQVVIQVGIEGPRGPGFTGAVVTGAGHLVLTATDGGTLDLGNVIGPDGPSGPVIWNAGTVTGLAGGLTLVGGVLWAPAAYTLPAATTLAAGGVIVGSNLTMAGGTLSLTGDNVLAALGYTPVGSNIWNAGIVTGLAGGLTLVGGVLSAPTAYALPAATTLAAGGVIVGGNLTMTGGTLSLTGGNVTAALGYTPPSSNIWNAGTVAAIDNSLVVNSGTLGTNNSWGNNFQAFVGYTGKPSAGQAIRIYVALKTIIPANLAGTKNSWSMNPAATAPFPLLFSQSGTIGTFGTLSLATSGTLTLPVHAAVTLDPANNDWFEQDAPVVQDGSLSDGGFMYVFGRG